MDLRRDFELNSLCIKFHFCLNSSGVWIFFFGINFFNLISISMNLFDPLVIVICNPVMKG